MKKINLLILIVSIVLLCSCEKIKSEENKPDTSVSLTNEKFILIDKGGYSERSGKYSSHGKYFLIRSIKDSLKFAELTRDNWADLSDSLYYNKEVGDTLCFETIKRSRFFKILKRK